MVLATVKVDNEFASLIPAPSRDELAGLEASMREHGCISPLVVWAGESILLDGHNRRDVCGRLGIEPEFREIELDSRDAAKAWIIRNQFSRRNLTPFQRAELALKLEPLLAAEAKERERLGGKGNKGVTIPTHLTGRVREKLAEQAGVCGTTLSQAKVILAEAPEEVKQSLREDKTTIGAEYRKLRLPPPAPAAEGVPQRRGMGVQYAHDAIAVLKKISINDALRLDGLKIVARWIRDNK